MDLNSNPNTRWASIFVDELALSGLEAVCISPGSRSTPLTLAFASRPAVRIYRHLDERSAGFFALGLALSSKRPVALVCTSGTAAANFHPAIIEAYYSHIPLLILTADRPPELRQSGANQTIDQIKMFGDHVRWSVEVPTPQAEAPDVIMRHLRTLAARAYATADGLEKGPVHLNFPFRKPLEPDESFSDIASRPANSTAAAATPYTRFSRAELVIAPDQVAAVAEAVALHLQGLIICGPDYNGNSFPDNVVALAERSGYPILADPLSNLRYGAQVSSELVLGGYPLWLRAMADSLPKPECILRFGSVPTSSALAAYLGDAAPLTHFHIRENGEWADDQHLTHHFIQAEPSRFCRAVAEQLGERGFRPDSQWIRAFTSLESTTWTAVDAVLEHTPFFDGAAVNEVLNALPDEAILFAGNSMPVRHIDTFGRPSTRRLTLFGNRGASGIDGNVSTALGLAAATHKPVVALLGDITFYHDMNGLLAVRHHGIENVTFVVINNDGGGIFHRLPIARHDPPFTDLFLTPHGLTFEHAAAMYGLRYCAINDLAGLRAVIMEMFDSPSGARLIEVRTDSAADYDHSRSLATAVASDLQHSIYRAAQ